MGIEYASSKGLSLDGGVYICVIIGLSKTHSFICRVYLGRFS